MLFDVVRVAAQQSNSEKQHDTTHDESRQISLCCTTPSYVTASYHKASLKHSADWNRQQMLQQTDNTLLPLVSPTCSRLAGSVNDANKPHSSRSSRRQRQTSSRSQRTKHRDGFKPSSKKVCTKARTPGKRHRKQSGRSGLSSWVRCWRIFPHQ